MINITAEISARHVHLTAADWQRLFGDQPITPGPGISQPPQFVAMQRVTLRGPKGTIERVGIVGPARPYTQAELAVSDARVLGSDAPLSESGKLDRAAEVTIIGAVGQITVPAAIIQRRHIHAHPNDIQKYVLQGVEEVSVRFPGPRGGVLDHVLIRVHPSFNWHLHLDTDEANACGVTKQTQAEVIVPL